MMDLNYPEWQKPYKAALAELDLKTLSSLVAATETAMFLRLKALAASSDGPQERQAIADASQALLMIKSDKLKFPGPSV
jgi:hypothetical protein